jgi:hypothetical protein
MRDNLRELHSHIGCRDSSFGVYVYALESGGYTSVKKCILMK